VSKYEQRCLATIIVNFISKTLMICFGPKGKKLMMEKALGESTLHVSHFSPFFTQKKNV
jgi:hypothetical protein